MFDANGGPVRLERDRIVIARTAATIDAIPASHSIAIEARDSIGTATVLDYLVKEGDQLPKRGQRRYTALRVGPSGLVGIPQFQSV